MEKISSLIDEQENGQLLSGERFNLSDRLEAMERSGVEIGEEVRQNLDRESGMLQKFEGKAKKYAGIIALTSFIAAGMVGCKKSSAQGEHNQGPVNAESNSNAVGEDSVVAFLEKLYDIPDNSKAPNERINLRLKADAARDMLLYYVSNKAGNPEKLSRENVQDALQELGAATGLLADKKYGDNDGEPEIEEIERMREQTKSNIGANVLKRMLINYSR